MKEKLFRYNAGNKSRPVGARSGDVYGKNEIAQYKPLGNDLSL